jgi:high affinity Mn2+ porin
MSYVTRITRYAVTRAAGTALASAAAASLQAQTALPPSTRVTADAGTNWNGWYLGGFVGYNRGTVRLTPSVELPNGSNALGYSIGDLHAGRNFVLPSGLLLGAEAGVSFPDFFEDGVVASRTTAFGTGTEKIEFVTTLDGRAGFARDRWLFYATAGLALSETRIFESSALSSDTTKVARLTGGWVAGGGAEYAITREWSIRAEYSFEQFAHMNAAFPSGTTVDSRADIRTLRLGVSRTFGSSDTGASDRPTHNPSAVDDDRWNIHGQDTFVEQGYFKFRSPYEGANSLSGASQAKNTESATAFLGMRLWRGAELYFDPEIDEGFGLNNTHGVAAFPNGEAQKASFPMPRFVVDRLFVRQIFGLGGERETVRDGPNQLAATPDISRITVVAGRLAVTDYFDVNKYANDPRTNFLNWNTYGAGAYDWTMDQLSWTWGALVELNQNDWALRAGYFLLPIVSSNNSFDTHIPARGEYAAEFEWRYSLIARPGKLRVFGWVNHGTMGEYAEALALPATTPNYPDIALTRRVRSNPGIVLNAEQEVTTDLGLFSRASWSPGQDEILGGTEGNQSWSLGGVLTGKSWGRPSDDVGVAGVISGLSPSARSYFAAGGLGILIGDGGLNYRAEQAAEAYYSCAALKWLTVSFDYQRIVNPGFNADRGPVSIFAVRVHTAF